MNYTKRVFPILLLCLCLVAVLPAQTVTSTTTPPTTTPPTSAGVSTSAQPAPLPMNALFAGVGLGPTSASGAQHAVGTAGYLRQVDPTTYAFARYDILGLNKKPLGLQTVVTAGVCQILRQVSIFYAGACLDGGTAVAGSSIGGAIGADGLAGVRFGKNKNLSFVVMGGIMKTALGQAVNPIRAVFVYGF